MSEEVSQTSGTLPVSGTYLNSTPWMVSFDVNDTNAAFGSSVRSAWAGIVLKLSASPVQAIFTPPTFFASLTAFCDQAPDTT